MSVTNWLVSSAGRRGHLVAILREAAEISGGGSVIAVDASPLSAAGLLADEFELVPRVDEPAFVRRILEICEQYSIQHIVPTIDPELPVYAAARRYLESSGHEVWVSSPEVVALGADKWLFHRWLRQHGLGSPATVEIRDRSAVLIGGPVVAKPRNGSASIGLIRAPHVRDLPVDEIGDDYLIQQVALGYEVTVDFAVDRLGNLLGLSARRRLEVRAGEVSKAVTIDHPELRSEVEHLVALLPGAFGVLNVQAIVDDEGGTITFIELNPRFGGGFPLSWHAGARWPLSLLNVDQQAPRNDVRPGVVMLRYDQAVFADAGDVGL